LGWVSAKSNFSHLFPVSNNICSGKSLAKTTIGWNSGPWISISNLSC
jgi:hypothetical protein